MDHVIISRIQVYLMQKELNNNIYSFKLTTEIDDLTNDFNLLIAFEDIVIEEEYESTEYKTDNQTDVSAVTDTKLDYVPFELS
jgi:hypothetical protein